MVRVKYVGVGRRGTIEPRRIWAPGEIKELSPAVAKTLLQDPDFVEVKPKQKAEPVEKPARGSKKKG